MGDGNCHLNSAGPTYEPENEVKIMTGPAIAICVPYHDRVHAQFAASLAMAMQRTPNATLIMSRSSIVTRARNACIGAVEKSGRFEFVFFADTDMTFPADTILRLVAHDKDIIGASYMNKSPPYSLMAKTIDGGPITAGTGIIEIAALPLGCILLRRSIFTKMKRPYFRLLDDEQTGETHGEDYVFCRAARSRGYHIFVDIDLTKQVGHIGEQILMPSPSG
jgi:hypothetical protein